MNSEPSSCYFESFQTRFDEISIVYSYSTGISSVKRIFLSREGRAASDAVRVKFPEARARSLDGSIEQLKMEILVMLSGGIPDFSIDLMDFSVCSKFQKKVLLEERKIPRGEVRTYGWLAEHTGFPGASRAVGNALASNPFPLIIPCHRTVRSDGGIGGFQGGPSMKRALLEMEGVNFTSLGSFQLKKTHQLF